MTLSQDVVTPPTPLSNEHDKMPNGHDRPRWDRGPQPALFVRDKAWEAIRQLEKVNKEAGADPHDGLSRVQTILEELECASEEVVLLISALRTAID